MGLLSGVIIPVFIEFVGPVQHNIHSLLTQNTKQSMHVFQFIIALKQCDRGLFKPELNMFCLFRGFQKDFLDVS